MRRWLMLAWLVLPGAAVHAADLTDATGRVVHLHDTTTRVLPAGPPAAVLLEALAPDLMIGWPHTPSPEALAWLPPAVRALPAVPFVAGRPENAADIAALHPDLILDYGTVSPRYADADAAIQAKTGVPAVLLDGAIGKIPATLRTLGAALGRAERAETLAREAEAILAAIPSLQASSPRVLFVLGSDGLDVVAPGSPAAEVFTVVGWQLVAPPGEGGRRHTSLAEIAKLDPDMIIYEDPALADTIQGASEWRDLRAIKAGHAYAVPARPFGWLGEPPSLNRLLGVAWLSQRGPGFASVAAQFMTAFYGQAPDDEQVAALQATLRPMDEK